MLRRSTLCLTCLRLGTHGLAGGAIDGIYAVKDSDEARRISLSNGQRGTLELYDPMNHVPSSHLNKIWDDLATGNCFIRIIADKK